MDGKGKIEEVRWERREAERRKGKSKFGERKKKGKEVGIR